MPRAYLGLGSNLGDRLGHLGYGFRELAKLGALEARSPILETAPEDCPGGEMFLNACVCLQTKLEPAELLNAALRIERARGRRRHGRNEPRVLDIDLLFVEGRVIRESGLTVPHPRLHTRRFVLEPLAGIAPRVIHPVLGMTVEGLAAGLP